MLFEQMMSNQGRTNSFESFYLPIGGFFIIYSQLQLAEGLKGHLAK